MWLVSFSEITEKINDLVFMYDLKLYSRSEEKLDSLVQAIRVSCEDIRAKFGKVCGVSN